jgi:hypothetical protein
MVVTQAVERPVALLGVGVCTVAPGRDARADEAGQGGRGGVVDDLHADPAAADAATTTSAFMPCRRRPRSSAMWPAATKHSST